ncbi:MAG: hypothetical protein K6T30_06895 [Alicyclobacillus sp.]|nr:hypothetical protein [Alicyclobacillus sp.]
MRTGISALAGILAGILVFGLLVAGRQAVAADADFLLTVIAAAGALGGIAFALYGWYTAKELPDRIRTEVEAAAAELEKRLFQQRVRQQEALQKVIAAYALGPDQTDSKIALLESVLELDPAVYNGYVALGYTYWYGKGDLRKAAECFLKDLEVHPDNYQAACDLAALHATQQEWLAALAWTERALTLNPKCWQALQSDVRLEAFRAARPDEFADLIRRARQRAETPG